MTAMIAAFFRWWANELKDMLPRRRGSGPIPGPRLVVMAVTDGAAVFTEDGRRHTQRGAASSTETIEVMALPEVLRRKIAESKGLPVGIRVRSGDCFVRTMELPAAAQRDFARMLSLDLERTTPLKSTDVLAAHLVEGPGSERHMVRVRHLVLKTRTISALEEAIREAGARVDFVDCLDADGSKPLPVDFLAASRPTSTRTTTAQRSVTAAIAGLALLAVGTYWVRHELALSTVEARIGELESMATTVRRALEQARAADADAARLKRLEAERHSSLVLLDEVTRLVPDTAWVQEFRLDGGIIEITGLAQSAAALLPAFERSDWFHEARFTAPVRVEPGEDRERFRLQVKLRNPPPAILTR